MSRKPIKFDEDGLPIPIKEQQPVSFDSDGLPIPIKKKDTTDLSTGGEQPSPTQSSSKTQSLFGKFPTKDEYVAANPSYKPDDVLQPPKQTIVKDETRLPKPIVGETLGAELANRNRYQQTKEKKTADAIAEMRATVPKSLGGTMEKERASLGTAFAKGAASVISSTLKSIGIAAKNLDFFNEYEGKKAEDLATYKAGKWIEDKVNDLVGDLSPEDKQRFSIKLAEGAGQMVGFVFGGLSSKALKVSPLLTTAGLGAAVSGASEYEAALQAGASEEQAAKAFWINATLGTTEALPIMGAFRKMDKYTGGAATGVLAKKLKSTANRELTNEMVGGILGETAQEVFVQALSNVSAAHTYDATRKIYDGLLETAAISSIIGGAMTGTAIAIRNKRAAGNLTKEEDTQLAAAQKFAEDKADESLNPEKSELTTSTPNNPKVKAIIKAKTDIEADLASEKLPEETQVAMQAELAALDQQLEVAKTEAYQQELNNKTATEIKNGIAKNEALLGDGNLTEGTKALIQNQINADKEKLSKIETDTYLINGERVSEEVFLSSLESKRPVDYEYNGEDATIIQKLKDVGGKSETTTTEVTEPLQQNEPTTKEQGTETTIPESTQTTGQGNAETTTTVLTKEAEDLLASVGEGSMPTFITKNLEKIAADNGVVITDKMTAVDVINALKEKQISNEAKANTTVSDVVDFNLNDIRNPRGKIGEQGFTEEGARDLLTYLGIDVKGMGLKEMVEHLKSNPNDLQKLLEFTKKNPIELQKLPDGSYYLKDGNHRANLLYYAGIEIVPSKITDVSNSKAETKPYDGTLIGKSPEPQPTNEAKAKEQGTETTIPESTQTTGQGNAETTTTVLEQPIEASTPSTVLSRGDEPSAEQQLKDIQDGNIVTFEYKNESEVPDVFKDKISSKGEINGKPYVKVTMAKSLADFHLQAPSLSSNTPSKGQATTTNESKAIEVSIPTEVEKPTITEANKVGEEAETQKEEQPPVVPPIPPLTNTERSNEGELRDKGILASMHKSVPESAKAKIDEKGLKYRVSSQAEAKAIATQILEDHGVDIAIEYASNAKLDGDVRSMLYNVSLNKLAEMEKAETNETAKKEIANKYADTLIDYDEMGRDAGRFNSAIFDFYKSPLGMEFYENKKRESSFKKEETKNGKSWNEFYEEFKDEPEFGAMVQAEILKEKMKKPGFAKKAADSLRKKADDILKNGITPDWLKADIKDAKTKGIDAKMVDKAIAKALKIIADAIEVGGNIANVIAEQVQKIKELGVSAKDSEIAKWLYKESGATGMDAKSFQDKVAEKIASLQKSIDSYKQKLADKEFSVKEGEVTNEQIKELEQQLKDAKKAYFEAKKDFPAYKAKMSERYLDRMRKKLKGLNEKQQREVIEQSFRKLAENGALDQDDFREIIKNTLGLGKLGKAEADVMKSLVEDINAVDDARKNFVNENGSPESEKKLNDAEMKALKSKQKLATIVHTQTDAWNTVRAAMQLTAIGVPTILKNFAWNFVQQGLIKFPANAIISLADASVSKAANILNLPYSRTTSLFGGEQGYFFKNMKKGIKEGVLALKYGINSKDYFDKEVYTKPIQPVKNAKDLLEWAKGNNKLKTGDVIDKLIKASPTGYYMEMVSRGLTFFDKPLRYAAEGGTAARIGSKELGLSGQQLNVFTRSPKEYAIKYFQSKGDDIATATKKAESIVSRITESGDKSVAQQANMLSDAFNNAGRFIKDKTDDKVLGKTIVGVGKIALTPATLFIKTPANVAWQVFNLINPSVAVAQSVGLSANAYRKFKNGDVTYKQDLDRAKDWMGTAAVGVGLGMLGQFLSGIGVVESGEDEDTKKKERDATKQYSKKFTFNYSKFNRYIQGIPDSPDDEDLRIDLSWYAQVGAMMDLKERMRKLTKDEPDMSSLDMALEELSESAKIAISSSALNSASMLSNAFTSYDGFKGYGVNSINTMANIVHPQALAQHSRATLDKEYQIKADGFIKQLDNSFSARSSLYRKVTGHYPPSDIGIWGDEIKKGGSAGLRYFGISRDNKNPFAKEIYDDAERTGNLDFLPSAVKNSITKNGETVKLPTDAARYLEQQVGLERKKLVTAYVDGALTIPGYGKYKTLSDEKKLEALSVIYKSGYDVGKFNFYQKYPQYNNEKTVKEKKEDKKESDQKSRLRKDIKKKQFQK